MKPFVSFFFFSCYVHHLPFPSSSCFSPLFWPTSITVAEGLVLECTHTHTQIHTASIVSGDIILALFSCFTFKSGAGSRRCLPHPRQLLPTLSPSILLLLHRSDQPSFTPRSHFFSHCSHRGLPWIQIVTFSVLCRVQKLHELLEECKQSHCWKLLASLKMCVGN